MKYHLLHVTWVLNSWIHKGCGYLLQQLNPHTHIWGSQFSVLKNIKLDKKEDMKLRGRGVEDILRKVEGAVQTEYDKDALYTYMKSSENKYKYYKT